MLSRLLTVPHYNQILIEENIKIDFGEIGCDYDIDQLNYLKMLF
jgi:hypothetical protein